MVRLDRDAIVAQLQGHGMTCRSVTVQTEGEYQVADVDWNNKDVPHLNHVHSWADDVTCVIERNQQATISLQQVLGITFPTVIVHYDTTEDHQAHFFTILAWTFVTEIEFVRVTSTRTRVRTTYTVAASRFWMLFFPVIRLLLRRNYRRLMSEDVPLRERRGQLRAWGYTFRGDEQVPRDIRASLAIGADNVIPPAEPVLPTLEPVPLSSIGTGAWLLLGRNDHLGLKLTRVGDHIAAYARSCPHEGADLDETPVSDGCLVCPWHGRKLAPLATLPAADGAVAATPWHRLTVRDGALVVEVVTDGRTAPPAPTSSTGR